MKGYALAFLALAMPVLAQTASTLAPPPDPNAPQLTLDEKIALVADDVRRSDVLEKAQKEFIAAIKPINDHQDATKKVIEDEHPGWTVESTQQGWQLVKKQEAPKPPEPAKTEKH